MDDPKGRTTSCGPPPLPVPLKNIDQYDIEYWSLEDAKLKRLPPEKSLAGKIVVVVGAGSGIGKSAAILAAEEDAHVVCVDINIESAKATSDEINNAHG